MYILIFLGIVAIAMLGFMCFTLSCRIFKLEGRYRVLALQYNDYMEEMQRLRGQVNYTRSCTNKMRSK